MQKRSISAEFYAQGYRVSGNFNVLTRPLADVIYDPTSDYIRLYDAYISPIMDPARIGAYYAETLFDKSNLDFVLIADQRDGLRRDQRFGLGRQVLRIFLTVPFFEIQGNLYIPKTGKFDSRLYLSTEAGTFITLLKPIARCTFAPDVVYEGGVALVSRSKISFFGEKAG